MPRQLSALFSHTGKILLLLLAMVCGSAIQAWAVTTTTPGSATLTAASTSLSVQAPYSGDDTTPNNTLKIEWSDDYWTTTSSVDLPHAASPYTYQIDGLTDGTTYLVRVTYLDADGFGGGVNIQTLSAIPCNPLIHNAWSTGSSEWSGSWGTNGGQYGEFTCATCHVRNSGNIKRVRSSLTAPSGSFPVQTAGGSITFTDASDSPTGVGFGDDSDRTVNRICEGCHSQNKYHNLNTGLNTSNTHNNNSDCTTCHLHKEGFRAGACYECHGGSLIGTSTRNFWPDSTDQTVDSMLSANDSGEHELHMTVLAERVYTLTLAELLDDGTSASKQTALCAYCHPSPGADGDHSNGDDAEVAFLQIWDGTADTAPVGALGYDYLDPTTATCSGIDCHNNKTTPATQGWYAGSTGDCLLCHTEDASNTNAFADPASGLHIDQSVAGVTAHDGNFGSGGSCTSCHTDPPTGSHINGTPDTDTAGYTFDAAITVNTGDTLDDTDDTCAASCHSDSGIWYRRWSLDAFDETAVVTDQPLPARCAVCHGVFGDWSQGTSHAGTNGGTASSMGSSHNTQVPNAGEACEDCHVYPSSAGLHENGVITLNDSAAGQVDPVSSNLSGTDYIVCQACHDTSDLPPLSASNVFPESLAFGFTEVDGPTKPQGGCFSGAVGCHGDTAQNWWPAGDPYADGQPYDPADPAYNTDGVTNYGYPNRVGAHLEHNLTIGQLIADARTGIPGTTPIQEDYNHTCKFCHPMQLVNGELESINHHDGKTDLYGGFVFPGADAKGVVSSGDPANDAWSGYDTDPTDGYMYQLDNPVNPGINYPFDGDGTYRQFLYNQRADASVNHGTCSSIACHSNAPFTPNWYGDEQAPAALVDLAGATHDTRGTHVDGETDHPGTVLLTWTAPGDNGDFDGTAYEYEVYYSTSTISEATLGSATRASGAPTVHRKGDPQEMVVEGLTPGTAYYFAVRTKDQPFYEDTDDDGIHETFVREGNLSPLAFIGPVTAHVDDVKPVFWGIKEAYSHDSSGKINVYWDSARDHTLPIIYRIYYSTYSLKTHLAMGGTLPEPGAGAYGGGYDTFGYTEYVPGVSPPVEGGSDYQIQVRVTKGIECQIEGLSQNVLYTILVRAEDGTGNPPTTYGNVDENRVVTMAMATDMAAQDKVTMMYLANGTAALTNQTDLTAPDWAGATDGSTTGAVTWRAATDLDDDLFGTSVSREVWLDGISFDIKATNGDKRLPHSFNLEFGYNNGGDIPLGTYTVTVGRRATRIMKVGLSDVDAKVDANARLYVKLTPSDTSVTFAWGEDDTKGQLLVIGQAINHAPSQPTGVTLVENPGGYVDVTWTPSNDGTPSDGGQTLHYDVVASCDGGAHWCYIIGLNKNATDATNGIIWDTVGNGLTKDTFDCQVRVEASDGYLYETSPGNGIWESHILSAATPITIDNILDDEAPAAVTINHVEPRPKQGTAYVHWTAVGNDGLNHGTRADRYDIRYRKVADGDLVTNWNDLDDSDGKVTVQAKGAPSPDFSGNAEEFEVVDMTPDTDYQIGIVTCDESNNCSGISNVYTITSGQYYCGICHSTPPDEPDTRGTHRQHGYTEEDCANCHGDAVLTYDGRHYDGVINIGWARNSDGSHATPVELANASGGSGVTITQMIDGVTPVTIYLDEDGAGGYNAGATYNPGAPLENTDSGTCMSFTSANTRGCHGPFNPKWESDTKGTKVAPTCADCHGDKTMAVNNDAGDQIGRLTDPYGRQWDQHDDNQAQIGGIYPPEQEILASPLIDNHDLGGKDTRYTGAHLRHLNASYRFAQQDSCRLCHENTQMLGLHANGEVDVLFDPVAGLDEASPAAIDQTHGTVDTVGASCSSLNNTYCHDTGANWAEPGAKCNNCHGMGGKAYDTAADTTEIGHVMGAMGDVVECTYCHVPGHPQSLDGITPGDPDTLLINNNVAAGIDYRSGGIHLRKVYPWGTYNTLAEICWGCHDQNHDGILRAADGDVSEWEVNDSAVGGSDYNFGQLDGTSWVGTWNGTTGTTATWNSGYGVNPGDPFYYKMGRIQSTHTTDPNGTSKLTWDAANGRYNETPDTVDKIRCSNCHDVHDLNLTPGDTNSGAPYLRGSWMSNPYEEDGAPYNKTYTNADTAGLMGAVPRGTTAYRQLGGYYIDQNNVVPGTGNTTPVADSYPTSGWTLESSAGLCIRCHKDVDKMDQYDDTADGYNLWLGTNGHSNSAIGGSFTNATNIFDVTHGRPAARPIASTNTKPADYAYTTSNVYDMGMTSQSEYTMGLGPRSASDGNGIAPLIAANFAFNSNDWGASVDSGVDPDQMYHQFSCSKCHNPHASRLPKLMITNCLDIRHNTWDDANSGIQNVFSHTDLTAVDRNMRAGYFASAANCHRFDPARGDTNNDNAYEDKKLRGGWNRVTPWVKSNDGSNAEHKGTTDPAYGTSNSTSPWTHSDFPTEPTGW